MSETFMHGNYSWLVFVGPILIQNVSVCLLIDYENSYWKPFILFYIYTCIHGKVEPVFMVKLAMHKRV